MRLSIGRKCSAVAPHLACEESLEVVTSNDTLDISSYIEFWESLAAQVGWRRIGAASDTYDSDGFNNNDAKVRYLVVSHAAVIVCPACAKVMGLECARCLNIDCSCMGGPRFEARLP
jgi:hypothetical protein